MNNIITTLYAVLIMAVFALLGLMAALIIIKNKESKQQAGLAVNNNKQTSGNGNTPVTTKKIAKEYDPKSIFDFMEFENVKDNMIIQKNGKRFLMAIECQGVNYDLMSEVEKAATEQGFAMFLNSLKDPIQIYIQTRTVNLEKNLQDYKARVKKVKDELNLKEYRLKQYLEQENVNEKVIQNQKIEILRDANLYDYGRDIIADSERMSLNKNILKKKYYVIIKYFYEPIDAGEEEVLAEEEIVDIAFSNLYAKVSSTIRALAGMGIVGRALNSFELVDLLYNAYNRDDAEVFGLEKAIEAGYNDIYIGAQSAIDKKINALNKMIEMNARERAQESVNEAITEKEKELKYIEDNLEDIIAELAINAIKNGNIAEDIKEKATEKIASKKKGGKETNGKKQTKESNGKRRAG